MIRFASPALAACAALIALAPVASAQTKGPFYWAKPAAPSSARVVVRDTLWKCGDQGCSASAKSASRAAIVCQSLVKEVGKIDAFRAGDEEFDSAALEKCNAKA